MRLEVKLGVTSAWVSRTLRQTAEGHWECLDSRGRAVRIFSGDQWATPADCLAEYTRAEIPWRRVSDCSRRKA